MYGHCVFGTALFKCTTATVLRQCYFGPDTFNFYQHLLETVFMLCNMSAAINMMIWSENLSVSA